VANQRNPNVNEENNISRVSWAQARECAAHAKATYGHAEDPATIAIHDDPTDTRVHITDLGSYVIVAVKGTDSLREWLLDAEAWMRPLYLHQDEFGRVHSGFYEAYQAVADRVDAALVKIGKPVIFTGHSLGGAIAVLLAHLYTRVNDATTLKGVYTFGQPRVGDGQFSSNCKANFGSRHFRFVDELDIVTRLPGLLVGYRHSGQCQFLVDDTAVENPTLFIHIICDAITFWRMRRSGPVALALGVTKLIEDHSMDRYIQKLNALKA